MAPGGIEGMQNRFVAKLREYGQLGREDTAALTVATAHPRIMAMRHDLIREGDRPGPVFVMLDGWACRYKLLPSGSRQVLAFLMPGDFCDLHVGLLAEMDHSIQTITRALVATIDRTEIETIMERFPAVARALRLAQLVDEGTMRAWITSVGRRTTIERVAHLMCELFFRARSIGLATGPRFALPVTQLLLADALGMTAVHLNRVLKELRVGNTMSFNRGSLFINDPIKLVQTAGFNENYLHRRLRDTA